MPRILLSRLIRADAEKIFDMMADRENLARMLPEYVASVRIRSSRGNVSVVEERLQIAGEMLLMMTKHVLERPRRHEIYVIGGDAKGSRLTWTYEAAPGGTLATIRAEINLGLRRRITAAFERRDIRDGFVDMMERITRLAEA